MACFRDAELEGVCSRFFEPSPSRPLGLSWAGALSLLLASKKQLSALGKATIAALGGQSVTLIIKHNHNHVTVSMKNAKLEDVTQALERACEAVARLPESRRKRR